MSDNSHLIGSLPIMGSLQRPPKIFEESSLQLCSNVRYEHWVVMGTEQTGSVQNVRVLHTWYPTVTTVRVETISEKQISDSVPCPTLGWTLATNY